MSENIEAFFYGFFIGGAVVLLICLHLWGRVDGD